MDVDVGSSAPAASEAAAGDAADLELRRFTTDFLSHCCSAIPLCGMTLSMGNNWRRNRSGVRASCSRKFASKVIHELQLIKGRRMVKPPTAALDGWQFMLNRHADDRQILVKEKGHDKQWNGQRISEAMCGLYLKRLLPVDHLLAHQRTLSASHQSLTARQDHTLTQAPPAWPDPMSHSPAVWRPSTVGAAAPWRQWLRGS